MMKQNLTNIFLTFLVCLFTFHLHTVIFYFCFLFIFFCVFSFTTFLLFLLFIPSTLDFVFSFSLVLGRLFELIFALLINFLILFLLLMSLSHAFLPFLFFFFLFKKRKNPSPQILLSVLVLWHYTKTLCKQMSLQGLLSLERFYSHEVPLPSILAELAYGL